MFVRFFVRIISASAIAEIFMEYSENSSCAMPNMGCACTPPPIHSLRRICNIWIWIPAVTTVLTSHSSATSHNRSQLSLFAFSACPSHILPHLSDAGNLWNWKIGRWACARWLGCSIEGIGSWAGDLLDWRTNSWIGTGKRD